MERKQTATLITVTNRKYGFFMIWLLSPKFHRVTEISMKHTNTTRLAEPTTRPQIPRHFFLALRVNTKLCGHVYQAGRVANPGCGARSGFRCREPRPWDQFIRGAVKPRPSERGYKDQSA